MRLLCCMAFGTKGRWKVVLMFFSISGMAYWSASSVWRRRQKAKCMNGTFAVDLPGPCCALPF